MNSYQEVIYVSLLLLGILATFVTAGLLLWLMPAQAVAWASLAVCALVMWAVGLADDRWKLGARVRLVIQAALALIMVYGGGVVLTDLGDPFLLGTVTLGVPARRIALRLDWLFGRIDEFPVPEAP